MITDEIQELLDGGLGDERTAELLHTLSVSPEKRTAFRQYLGMRAEMQRDRLESALSAGEDTAMWSAITGSAALPPVATAATRRSWIARGAALLAAGTIGYLLGTTTIIAPTEASLAERRGRAAQHVEGPRSRFVPPAASQTEAPRAAAATAPRVEYRDRIVYRDRVVYRDRIVYRDRAAATVAANTDTPLDVASQSPASIEIAPLERQPVTPPALDAQSTSTPNPAVIESEGPLPYDTSSRPAANAIADNRPATRINGSDGQAIAAMMSEPTSPIDMGGWEATYAERVGILAPAPVSGSNADPGFSYRLLGLTYWLDGGRFGFGARAGYGSFSTVELERRESATGVGPEIAGTVRSTERIWMEGLATWRHPITNDLAIAIEGTFGGSSHHMKVSGDVVATYFVTDFLGLHGGAGLGRYWYSIAGERDRLLEDTPTGGVTSDTRSNYEGVMFEGRYGVFVRF